MRAFLIISVVIVAAQLCATEAPSGEPRAVLGELADRLLREFEQPERQLTLNLSLNDLVKDREEIAGDNCDASNYGLKVVSLDPPLVWIIYRQRHDYQPRGNYMVVDLAARTRVFADKPAPDEAGEFPFAPDEELDTERSWERTTRSIRTITFAVWWFGVVIWTLTSAVLVLGARRVDKSRPLRAALGSGDTQQAKLLMSETVGLVRDDRAAMAALGSVVHFVFLWSQIKLTDGGGPMSGWLLLILATMFFVLASFSFFVNGGSTRRAYSLALAVSAMVFPAPWSLWLVFVHKPPGLVWEFFIAALIVVPFWLIAWLRRRVLLSRQQAAGIAESGGKPPHSKVDSAHVRNLA